MEILPSCMTVSRRFAFLFSGFLSTIYPPASPPIQEPAPIVITSLSWNFTFAKKDFLIFLSILAGLSEYPDFLASNAQLAAVPKTVIPVMTALSFFE